MATLKEFLEAKATQRFFGSDNINDPSGRNFDDAYSIAVDDGEILMAREILYKLKSGELTLE